MFRRSPSRPGLGLRDGRLSPCGPTPNCVSSQAADPRHALAPLAFTGDPASAFERLEQVLARLPRTRIVARTGDYLHAECASRIFRFVDDLEFLLDGPSRIIHVRSASRVGYSDFGVNRRRVETIRRLFQWLQTG